MIKNSNHRLIGCLCGGRVGKYAAVKLHPSLHLVENEIRYIVKCARCGKSYSRKNGQGFLSLMKTVKGWNMLNTVSPVPENPSDIDRIISDDVLQEAFDKHIDTKAKRL